MGSKDPLTGEVIRASKTTAVRYERDRPGELVHMDVKKIGRIPDGRWLARCGPPDGFDQARSDRAGDDRQRLRRTSTHQPPVTNLMAGYS